MAERQHSRSLSTSNRSGAARARAARAGAARARTARAGAPRVVLAIVLILLLSATVWAGGQGEEGAGEAPPVRALIIPPERVTPGLLSGGHMFVSAVYDWMFRIDGESGEVVPSLVQAFEVSEDATEWTFTLRQGVMFHHGTELTAEDVIFTAERWIDPDFGSALQSVFGELIDSIEAVDTYTVRFTLSRPDVDFNLKLLDYNAAILAADYDYDARGESEPSGTGAFMVDQYVPRERASLVANPDYWKDNLPSIDRLDFLFVPEVETQIRMLESGQGDVVADISVDQFQRLDDGANTNGLSVQLGNHVTISMRSDKEPFNDPRVRQAFKLAVDREALLEAVMYGNGELGNDHPIPPFHEFYDELGGVREQDIERARSLLAEAGYPDGIDVTLYCGNNIAPVLDVAVAYQEMAAEAGINIEISSSTRDNYLSQHWLPADFKATLWGHREDVTQLLSLAYQSDGAWNEGHYANDQLDAAIRAASATRDAEARQEAFSDIQRILHDEGPTVVAFFQPFFGGTSTRIEGFYLTRNWINDFRYIRIAE